MTPKQRRTVVQVAAIGAPLLLFFCIKFMLAPLPSPASAHPDEAGNAQAPASQIAPPTAEQQQLAEWLDGMPESGDRSSPFNTQTPAPADTPAAPTAAGPVDPVAALRLTAVLGSSQGGAATINGRIYRPGDEVSPGIRLQSIDARAQRVTLLFDDGRVVELSNER